MVAKKNKTKDVLCMTSRMTDLCGWRLSPRWKCSLPWFTAIMHWRLWSEEGVAVDNFWPNLVQPEDIKCELSLAQSPLKGIHVVSNEDMQNCRDYDKGSSKSHTNTRFSHVPPAVVSNHDDIFRFMCWDCNFSAYETSASTPKTMEVKDASFVHE